MKKKNKVECSLCGQLVLAYVPASSDGTLLRLFKHFDQEILCRGSNAEYNVNELRIQQQNAPKLEWDYPNGGE